MRSALTSAPMVGVLPPSLRRIILTRIIGSFGFETPSTNGLYVTMDLAMISPAAMVTFAFCGVLFLFRRSVVLPVGCTAIADRQHEVPGTRIKSAGTPSVFLPRSICREIRLCRNRERPTIGRDNCAPFDPVLFE
jgi:hypothetical protein